MRSPPAIAVPTAMLVLAAPAGAALKRLEANLSGGQETAPGGDPDGAVPERLRKSPKS